jgi:anhydro-N-acetylmuramic acid kinase
MVLDEESWSIGPPTRVFAGIAMGRESRRLKLALVCGKGQAWQFRLHRIDGVALSPTSSQGPIRLDEILLGLQQLSRESSLPLESIDSLGLADLDTDPLPLAEQLADRLGITSLCRFAGADSLREAPALSAVADWFLFRSAKHRRIIIEIGSVLRLTFLPSSPLPQSVVVFDVGPANHFLNQLVVRLSQGKYPFDPSGHFAVQGQQDEEILSHWASHPFLLESPPRLLEEETFGENFIEASLAMARERRRAAKDLLCTASHFVARCLRDALHRFVPPAEPNDEVFLVGGGVRNGLMRKLIEETVAPRTVRQAVDIGVPDEVRPAAHAALWAYMAMENLSSQGFQGNKPPARPAGIIIPGSASHWDRWVCNLADRFDADARRAA